MPDLFVAPEDKNNEVMHKRVPAGESVASPINQDIPVRSRKQETITPNTKPDDKNENRDQKQSLSTIASGAASSPFIKKTVKKDEFETNTEQSNSIPLFASFWQNPKGVYFDTQEIDEHILLFVRRHPITNFGWIFSSILLALLPFAIMYATNFLGRPFVFGSSSFTLAVVLFYYMILAAGAFTNFLNWYYNISLITEKRVIDIELSNLIGKKVSATKITLVQDVNYQQNGTIRSIFDYGDVLIQTAGAVDNFYIHAAPKPEVVVRIIEDLIGEEGRRV